MSDSIPWARIDEFLLEVGSFRSPRELIIQTVKRIFSLVPYDQARIYFSNENGIIYDEVLFGVDQQWSNLYLEYYSKIDDCRYSIMRKEREEILKFSRMNIGRHDWTGYERDEFVSDYIIPQGIRFTMGSSLHDSDNFLITTYSIDRIGMNDFSQQEVQIINRIHPHIDNLHRNLYVRSQTERSGKVENGKELLTRRELEIAKLLCQGLTPNKIGINLNISLQTVYRHIANIHQKLRVSNRQELILKLLDKSEQIVL